VDPRLVDFPARVQDILELEFGVTQADFGQHLDLHRMLEMWAWELNRALKVEQGGSIRRVVIHLKLENLLTIVRTFYSAYQLVNAKISLGKGIQLTRDMEVLTLEAVQIEEPSAEQAVGDVAEVSVPFADVPLDGASPADIGDDVLISPQVILDDGPQLSF
jgi:hypothetical protein